VGSAVRTDFAVKNRCEPIIRIGARIRKRIRTRFEESSLTYTVLRRGLIGSACIMCIITLAVVVAGKYNGKRYMLEKSESVRYRVTNTFALPIWNLDQPMVDALVDLELRDPDMLGFAFYGRTGTLMFGYYRKGSNIFSYNDNRYTGTVFARRSRVDRAMFHMNGEDNGFVDIYFTDAAINQKIWDDILWVIIPFFIVGISLFIFLQRSIQRKVITPVVALSHVVREFSRKNFSVRSPVLAENEIGELALHFNEMADTIEKHSRNLETTVTERTQQLIDAEKMAALGELVAGISHEINTPVGTAITASSFIERSASVIAEHVNDGTVTKTELVAFLSSMKEAMDLTLSNLGRASELVQSFKKISVDRTCDDRRVFNLSSYLHDVVLSIRPRIKRTRHHIEIKCDAYLEIDSYPGDIWQIVTNFIMNSLLHAFPDPDKGGSIIIEAGRDGDDVVIRYSDNGVGISEENIGKIFNPFFTTKRGNGGSGLGLNIVYNLVTQKFGGRIECFSSPGKETVFTLRFKG